MGRYFNDPLRMPWMGLAACLVWALQPGPAAQAGVVGEWLFNGDYTDSSTNDNHGVPIGGPVFVDTPRGMGLSLDGIDDEVDFGNSLLYEFTEPGDPPLMQLTDMTIEAWVSIAPVGHGHFSSNTFDRVHKIFGKTANEYMLMYESAPPNSPELHRAGFAFFNIRPAIEYPCFGPGCDFSADPIALDTFIHIVGTKSSALGPANEASALFYNGILARKSGGFAPLFQGPDVHLSVGGPLVVDTGGGVLQTNWLQAVIEEVRIYDEYLSAEQVEDLFLAGPTHILEPINMVDADVGDQVGREFLSEAGTTYALECTTDLVFSNNWSATGAIVEGTGGTLTLYDPAGYSTSKLYRVAIQL